MAVDNQSPTGAGDFDEWAVTGAANSWSACDDAVGSPDDDTTYVSCTADSNTSWTFPTPSISAASITSVAVTMRAKLHAEEGGVTPYVTTFIRVGGSYSIGDLNSTTLSTWANYTETWNTNPNTSAAWTPSEIARTDGTNDLVQFGIKSESLVDGDVIRCTQAYITITYVEGGGGGGGGTVKTLTLLGVGA